MWLLLFVFVAGVVLERCWAGFFFDVGWGGSGGFFFFFLLLVCVLVPRWLGFFRAPGGVLFAAPPLIGMTCVLLMLRENFRFVRFFQREAMIDKLTELPNCCVLVDDLDVVCVCGRHMLVFFDLDGFKDYNDVFGYFVGDALLRRLTP